MATTDRFRVSYPTPPDSALGRTIARLAEVPVAVLFRGETGGGRRWMASTLHQAGGAAGRLVEVDGNTLGRRPPEDQLTEVRGACQRASGGALLIDEPGRLAASVQLQTAERIDLGSRPGARVLAVSTGAEGTPPQRLLLDRLMVVDLPPLLDRDADLPQLLDHYLAVHARDQGVELPWGVERALAYLRWYRWPATLEEIESFAAAAVRQRDARVVARQEVRRLTGAAANDWACRPRATALQALREGRSVRLKEIRRLAVQDAEHSWLERTLESVAGDRHRAAELLGISYKVLSTKLRAMAPRQPSS